MIDKNIVAMILAVFLLTVSVSAGQVSSNIDMSGTGLMTGSTSSTDGKSMYNEDLMSSSGSYKANTIIGNGETSTNRLVSGTNIHYSETTGYSGLTSTNVEPTGPCASEQTVDYKQLYSGSQFMMDRGTIQSGSSTDKNSLGYIVKANGEGTGNVWSSAYTAYGRIYNGCFGTNTNLTKQLGYTLYGSSNTVRGVFNLSSLFKYTWV